MTTRHSPYIHRPPPTWEEDVAAMQNTMLMVVSTIGPTVFVLKADDDLTDNTYKVYIGERQMCSCGGGEAKSKLCIHILFVMLKVLRVPTSNPFSWQLSLIDSEVNQILSGDMITRRSNTSKNKTKKHTYLKKGFGILKQKVSSTDNEEELQQQKVTTASSKHPIQNKNLEEGTTCCICFDEMTTRDLEGDLLCYCESSCGGYFHKKCFLTYSTHARSQKKPVICPLCRAKWTNAIRQNMKTSLRKRMSMPLVRCQLCDIVIRATIYRCVNCAKPNYNLCRHCFEGKAISAHDKDHIFVKAESSQYPANWTPAIPQIVSRTIYHSLQEREIGDADYHTLLLLDDNSTVPLHKHLVRALPSVTSSLTYQNRDLKCTYCLCPLSKSDRLKQLPCSGDHLVHESCALGILIDFESSGYKFGAVGSTCPTCKDQTLFFPSLKREPKKKKTQPNRESQKENMDCSSSLVEKQGQLPLLNAYSKQELPSLQQCISSFTTLSVHGVGKSIYKQEKPNNNIATTNAIKKKEIMIKKSSRNFKSKYK